MDETRFPREIRVADCLCKGCIINKSENAGYISKPVLQSKIVIKWIPCHHDGGSLNGYLLKTEYVNVPIACTCVVPKTVDMKY